MVVVVTLSSLLFQLKNNPPTGLPLIRLLGLKLFQQNLHTLDGSSSRQWVDPVHCPVSIMSVALSVFVCYSHLILVLPEINYLMCGNSVD